MGFVVVWLVVVFDVLLFVLDLMIGLIWCCDGLWFGFYFTFSGGLGLCLGLIVVCW